MKKRDSRINFVALRLGFISPASVLGLGSRLSQRHSYQVLVGLLGWAALLLSCEQAFLIILPLLVFFLLPHQKN